MPIPEIFRREGEAGFRRRETAVLAELGQAVGAGPCDRRRQRHAGGKLPAAAPERRDLLPAARAGAAAVRGTARLAGAGRRRRSTRSGSRSMRGSRTAMIDNDGTPEDGVRAQILEVLG